jgi:hypothetical protein
MSPAAVPRLNRDLSDFIGPVESGTFASPMGAGQHQWLGYSTNAHVWQPNCDVTRTPCTGQAEIGHSALILIRRPFQQ